MLLLVLKEHQPVTDTQKIQNVRSKPQKSDKR
jgi:hypothetical protein